MRQMITAGQPGPGSQQRLVRGGWIWGAVGVATILALAVPGVRAIVRSGAYYAGFPQQSAAVPTRTVVVAQPVTALSVESYGAPIRVIARPVSQVTVTEAISFDPDMGRPPHVTDRVSRGLLTLAAPACQQQNCSVGFTVTVPSGIAVSAVADGGPVSVSGAKTTTIDSGSGPVTATDISGQLTVNAEGGNVTVSRAAAAALDSGGGPVTASGVTGDLTVQAAGGAVSVSGTGVADLDSGGGPVTAQDVGGPLRVSAEGGSITVTRAPSADLDSGGGPVTVTSVDGPLRVQSEGGDVQADDVTGALSADTGGGRLTAAGLTSATATVTCEGGDAMLGFLSSPENVQVQTGGGAATLSLPGGPYAVSANSGSEGPASVTVATNPSASRTLNVSTEGGPIQIGPA